MERFVPDIHEKNVYQIDYKKLKKRGIKCLIIDLDNTIASYDTYEPSKELKELFHKLSLDFKLIIISNNTKNRVRPFKEKLNVDSCFKAGKPRSKKYKKILELYNFKDTEIACIGDQLITDILGANKVGFTSILVNPISPMEPFRVRINRSLEKRIIKKIQKLGLDIKGDYYE